MRWIAKWRQDGKLYTHTFESTEKRIIAGIDFRLSMIDHGYTVPKAYVLDEADREAVQEEYHAKSK